jgi:hypothetical protein
LSAEQQTSLLILILDMKTNMLQAEIANRNMNVAQLNADQQRAVQNASMVANMDMLSLVLTNKLFLIVSLCKL